MNMRKATNNWDMAAGQANAAKARGELGEPKVSVLYLVLKSPGGSKMNVTVERAGSTFTIGTATQEEAAVIRAWNATGRLEGVLNYCEERLR